jgi:hypothetical protein
VDRYNDRSAAELLKGVQFEFREYCVAQVEFFEWLASNAGSGVLATCKAFERCDRAAVRYGATVSELEENFPEEAINLRELLMPIQQELFDR